MKCLVTGAAGFLGSNLVPVLLERGHEVVGLDDLSHGWLRNLAAVEGNDRFRFVRADVRDAAAVQEAARGVASIVHLAAGKIPRYGNSLETLDVNLVGCRNVLDACKEQGARAVIASTSDVYGMSEELPFREDGPLLLGTPHVRRWSYAASKIAAEHLALAYRESHGIEAVVLRFFGAYGENQNITWRGGPQAVFIGAALRGDELEVHGDGRQTRTFTYVSDTVRAIDAAIHTEPADGHVVNVGHERETSIADLAQVIWEMVRPGTDARLRFVPYETFGRYQDVRRRVPDGTLARELLGFRARVDLEEGLRRTIAWQARVQGLDWPGTAAGP